MNGATFVGTVIVVGIFIAILVHEIRKKRQGKSGCSCGCADCSESCLFSQSAQSAQRLPQPPPEEKAAWSREKDRQQY